MGETPPDSAQNTRKQQSKPKTKYQSFPRRRPMPAPRAPAFCAWCKDNNRVATHTTKHCDRFKKASIEGRWESLDRQGICVVCLIGKHALGRCPEIRRGNYRCQHCKYFHNSDIGCRPADGTRTHTANPGTSGTGSKAI